MALGDAERLHPLFEAGIEDGMSLFSPKSRRDPLSFADDLEVDVLS